MGKSAISMAIFNSSMALWGFLVSQGYPQSSYMFMVFSMKSTIQNGVSPMTMEPPSWLGRLAAVINASKKAKRAGSLIHVWLVNVYICTIHIIYIYIYINLRYTDVWIFDMDTNCLHQFKIVFLCVHCIVLMSTCNCTCTVKLCV